jgi:hypothetical protein
MASINNVVNTTLLADQQLAKSDNVNSVAIITTDRNFLNSNNRYAIYADANQVAQDFGSSSQVAAFANIFFAQQPNPVNAGGQLVIGYWRASSENVAATQGYLKGSQINELDVLGQLQLIGDGSFNVTIDGDVVAASNLDFTVIDSLSDAVDIIQAAIGDVAQVSYQNQQFIITSDSSGATSTVSFLTAQSAGTFIGTLLNLVTGSGAASIAGQDAQTLPAEDETDALSILAALIGFKGFMFIDQSTGTDRYNIALWAQANEILAYDVFYNPNDLTRNIEDSTAWNIKLGALTNYRMSYSTANNRMLAAAYMSREHTVNFAAQNAAITMNLKTLVGITPEDYTQSQINAANSIGLDLYTTIKDVPVLLTSEGNDFTDNRYNLIAFMEDVRTNVFNALKGTPTKIPQTTPGVNSLATVIEKTCQRYINAGVFAPGTWTSPLTFGNVDAFNRAIEQVGYYVLAGLLSQQSPQDRQARIAPPFQVAVKNAGAIHKVNIIINFNI